MVVFNLSIMQKKKSKADFTVSREIYSNISKITAIFFQGILETDPMETTLQFEAGTGNALRYHKSIS